MTAALSGEQLTAGVAVRPLRQGDAAAMYALLVASRAVAERLGFQPEGVRHESHWITNRFVDHVVYGMLDREWEAHSDG